MTDGICRVMYPNMLNLDMRILMRSFVGLSNTNTADILRTNNLSTLSMEYIAVRYQWIDGNNSVANRIRGKLNMATKRNHPILNHSPHSLVRHRVIALLLRSPPYLRRY